MGFFSRLFGKKEPKHYYATEYEKARDIYGNDLDEIIKYWAAFYVLKEKMRQNGSNFSNSPILQQLRDGLMQNLEYTKGKAMTDKVMKFGTIIDEDKFAREIDIINKVENDTTGKYHWD